jgi:hypothetical protein
MSAKISRDLIQLVGGDNSLSRMTANNGSSLVFSDGSGNPLNLTNIKWPVNNTDATNKEYVDSLI